MKRVTSSDVVKMVDDHFAKTKLKPDEVSVSLSDFLEMASKFGIPAEQLATPWFTLATTAGMVRVRARPILEPGQSRIRCPSIPTG